MTNNISAGSSDEIWYGARTVGDNIGGLTPRQVYHLHEQRRIPSFKLGRAICMRPAAWRDRVEQLERQAAS